MSARFRMALSHNLWVHHVSTAFPDAMCRLLTGAPRATLHSNRAISGPSFWSGATDRGDVCTDGASGRWCLRSLQ